MTGIEPLPQEPHASVVETLVRFGVGALFVVAGVTKVAHPSGFFSDLLAYQVPFPEPVLRLTAVSMPWLELFSGLALLADTWAETVRPVISALCLIFVIMLGQAVVRGLNLNCGCFGSFGAGWFERPDIALVRALVLLAISLYLMAVNK